MCIPKRIQHTIHTLIFNPLSANPTKWPNTLKQFVGKLRDFIEIMMQYIANHCVISNRCFTNLCSSQVPVQIFHYFFTFQVISTTKSG